MPPGYSSRICGVTSSLIRWTIRLDLVRNSDGLPANPGSDVSRSRKYQTDALTMDHQDPEFGRVICVLFGVHCAEYFFSCKMQRVRSRLSGYNINSKVLQFVLQLSRADLSLSSEIQSGDGGSKPAIEGGSFQLKVESPFPSV